MPDQPQDATSTILQKHNRQIYGCIERVQEMKNYMTNKVDSLIGAEPSNEAESDNSVAYPDGIIYQNDKALCALTVVLTELENQLSRLDQI